MEINVWRIFESHISKSDMSLIMCGFCTDNTQISHTEWGEYMSETAAKSGAQIKIHYRTLPRINPTGKTHHVNSPKLDKNIGCLLLPLTGSSVCGFSIEIWSKKYLHDHLVHSLKIWGFLLSQVHDIIQ